MAPLAEVVAQLISQCGARPTGVGGGCASAFATFRQAGLISDCKLVAEISGIPFTTLRETVTELTRQFGLVLDGTEFCSETTGDRRNNEADHTERDSWEEWAERTVEVNASSSMFSEDDLVARQIIAQRNRSPT